jgi:hypothetical protein
VDTISTICCTWRRAQQDGARTVFLDSLKELVLDGLLLLGGHDFIVEREKESLLGQLEVRVLGHRGLFLSDRERSHFLSV